MRNIRQLPVELRTVRGHLRIYQPPEGGPPKAVWVEEHRALRHVAPDEETDNRLRLQQVEEALTDYHARFEGLLQKYGENREELENLARELFQRCETEADEESFVAGIVERYLWSESNASALLLGMAPLLPPEERELIEGYQRLVVMLCTAREICSSLPEHESDPEEIMKAAEWQERLSELISQVPSPLSWGIGNDPIGWIFDSLTDPDMQSHLASLHLLHRLTSSYGDIAGLAVGAYEWNEAVEMILNGFEMLSHRISCMVAREGQLSPEGATVLASHLRQYAQRLAEFGMATLQLGAIKDEDEQKHALLVIKALEKFGSSFDISPQCSTSSEVRDYMASAFTEALISAADEIVPEEKEKLLATLCDTLMDEDAASDAAWKMLQETVPTYLDDLEATGQIEIVNECVCGFVDGLMHLPSEERLAIAIHYVLEDRQLRNTGPAARHVSGLLAEIEEAWREYATAIDVEIDPQETAELHPLLRKLFGKVRGESESDAVEFDTKAWWSEPQVEEELRTLASITATALDRLFIATIVSQVTLPEEELQRRIRMLPERLRVVGRGTETYLSLRDELVNAMRAVITATSGESIRKDTLITRALGRVCFGPPPDEVYEGVVEVLRIIGKIRKLQEKEGKSAEDIVAHMPLWRNAYERYQTAEFKKREQAYYRERDEYSNKVAQLMNALGELIAIEGEMKVVEREGRKEFDFIEFIVRYGMCPRPLTPTDPETREALMQQREKAIRRYHAEIRQRLTLGAKDVRLRFACGADDFKRLGSYNPDENSCFRPTGIRPRDKYTFGIEEAEPRKRETFVATIYVPLYGPSGEKREGEYKCVGRALGILQVEGSGRYSVFLTNFHTGANPLYTHALISGAGDFFARALRAKVVRKEEVGYNVPLLHVWKDGDGIRIKLERQRQQS